MKAPLTRRQKDALDFIEMTIDANGIAPSFTEIGDALGLHSKSGVHRIVVALVERGAVTHIANRARSIALVEQSKPLIGKNYVPIIGEWAAALDVAPHDVVEMALLEYFKAHPLPGERP